MKCLAQQRDQRERSDGRAELERKEILDVMEDGLALLHGWEDGAEIVVHEDHVGRFLRHIGAALAHGHADVSHLQRGRVVDPVANHGDDAPFVEPPAAEKA